MPLHWICRQKHLLGDMSDIIYGILKALKINSLTELSQHMLDPANGLVVFVVSVLQDGERADFSDNPGEKNSVSFA